MADAIQMADGLLLSSSDPAVQHECQGEIRCPHCSAVFSSEALLKAHCRSRVCPRILNRDRTSATVKDVHYKWRKEADQGDPVLMEGQSLAVTISIGAVMIGPDDEAEGALARADKAMYTAKRFSRSSH